VLLPHLQVVEEELRVTTVLAVWEVQHPMPADQAPMAVVVEVLVDLRMQVEAVVVWVSMVLRQVVAVVVFILVPTVVVVEVDQEVQMVSTEMHHKVTVDSTVAGVGVLITLLTKTATVVAEQCG
jgi:hypothetical protein